MPKHHNAYMNARQFQENVSGQTIYKDFYLFLIKFKKHHLFTICMIFQEEANIKECLVFKSNKKYDHLDLAEDY